MFAALALGSIEWAVILALQPPLSPPSPSLAPPGEKGGPTAVCGLGFEGGEFNVGGQPSK